MTEPVTTTRNCTDCGQVDDHPRDLVVLPDGSEAHHHIDCGARRTPPCQGCADQVEKSGGASGDDLRSFLRGDS